ncbi:MAG: NAD-dependent epimerase/dehydratase family protein [Kiritimatiellae bacterium]|nr:NAD-dependent epimerase/dehydratase family protein [Kiritimatiellia bacterium]MCO5068878.1 NAD-dependent epimerase/dehydratase family protein [Kiritimatiellia bacterium]
MTTSPLYLVTGGCGFIGSHLVEALLARGLRVRILDNLSSGHRQNLASVESQLDLRIGDIGDAAALRSACEGVAGVFHLAALVSVADSVERPMDNHQINATGTLNVLLAAREAGVKRVLLASTAAIYGNDPALPKTEDMTPSPESPYAAAKLMGEHYLRIFHRLYGMETVALRFFNVYGPRQDPRSPYSGVISRFVDALQNEKTPVVFGDGKQSCDFVFVADVVQGCLGAMFVEQPGEGSVYNIATSKPTDLLQLLATLGKLANRAMEPEFRETRAGDVRHSLASIEAARAALRYEPKYDLAAGLQRLLEESR